MGRCRLEEGDDNTRSEGQRGKVNSFDKGYLGLKGEGGLVECQLTCEPAAPEFTSDRPGGCLLVL